MTEMYLHGRKVESVFHLLGEHENDISYSVGWVLSQCPSFLNELLNRVIEPTADIDLRRIMIRLQHYEAGKGITDIEIESPGEFFLILEAKRGWNLPVHRQLETYATRISLEESGASFKKLVILSECSREYAESNLPVRELAGVPIGVLSWQEIAALARRAYSSSRYAEKRLIQELLAYLGGIITAQNKDSNWVYVVALAKGYPEGSGISWIDIVEKRRFYFHPIGGKGGWPKEPPNYIAFRYNGKLQAIHHIESYEVIRDPHDKIPEMNSAEWEPHYLYTLGPAFSPNKEIKTGSKIKRNRRVRCMLDTLFTCDSISEALEVSEERKRQSF